MKYKIITPEFVDKIPDSIEEAKIYISIPFATAIHKCCCGCGNEVVTPLTPTDWELTYDGESISLYPSIGNWGFPCQSHYWIRNNNVKPAPRWSEQEILQGRSMEKAERIEYFDSKNTRDKFSLKKSVSKKMKRFFNF